MEVGGKFHDVVEPLSEEFGGHLIAGREAAKILSDEEGSPEAVGAMGDQRHGWDVGLLQKLNTADLGGEGVGARLQISFDMPAARGSGRGLEVEGGILPFGQIAPDDDSGILED